VAGLAVLAAEVSAFVVEVFTGAGALAAAEKKTPDNKELSGVCLPGFVYSSTGSSSFLASAPMRWITWLKVNCALRAGSLL